SGSPPGSGEGSPGDGGTEGCSSMSVGAVGDGLPGCSAFEPLPAGSSGDSLAGVDSSPGPVLGASSVSPADDSDSLISVSELLDSAPHPLAATSNTRPYPRQEVSFMVLSSPNPNDAAQSKTRKSGEYR